MARVAAREDRQVPQDLSRYVPRYAFEWAGGAAMWDEVEGTLVFVDISGFTNLSERLARFGRIGAEELTDVLNRVFGGMLDLAYARGGSLLKFGGDALLLLFSGDDHAAQACSSAVEMRSALREASQWKTSVGRLRLRMSVGVHSGPVHLFRVGSSHLELMIAGPTATGTTAMETQADAGEIMVSPQTLALLPPGSGGAARGPGHVLRWRKAPLPAPGPVLRKAAGVDSVDRFLPVALLEHLRHGAAEPEHRIATIAFLKFKGTDALLSAAGAAAVAAALHDLVSAVQRAVDAEGVTFLATDLDADGGKIILATGMPVAQEDDEGRMLRVARRLTTAALPLPVRIGVNRGHVFAGEVGTPYRCAFTVMGDTVNLAARLMAAAPAGSVYATAPVLQASHTVLTSVALEPFHVKGKAQPVQAYEVGEETGTRAIDLDVGLPFTGRDAELDTVISALEAEDRPAVVVVGDVGSGKTRLLRETLERLSAEQVVGFRGEPFGASVPYHSVFEPLRRALGVSGEPAALAERLEQRVLALDGALLPLLPLVAPALHIDVAPTAEADAIESRFRPDRLADAVARLLDAAVEGEAVFFVDDGHWVDESSAHLLTRLAALPGRRWRFAVTRRRQPGGFDLEAAVRIELRALDRQASESLVVAATEATPLRPHEVELVVNQAGGNPLYLQEILRAGRELGSVEDLPESLDAVVASQIDRLAPLARRVLRFAAVLGRSFPRRLLVSLLAEVHVTLDAATRRDVEEVIERHGQELTFRHALLQQAAYEGLSYKRRRELHLLAGQTIERLAGEEWRHDAASLSFHFSRAGDHHRAWRYAREAGDTARKAYANSEAAVHYERALEAARRLPDLDDGERVRLWTALGDVYSDAGVFDRSLDAYRRASQLARGNGTAEAELLLRRARAREQAGRFASALREIAAARRVLRDVPGPSARRLEAQLLAFAASIRQAQSRRHDALRTALEASEVARQVGEGGALARAYDVLDWALLMLGRPEEAVHAHKALTLYEEIGDLGGQAMVLNTMGADAYFHGDWTTALEHYERSRTTYLRAGNEWRAAVVGMNIGEVLVSQGRLDEAEPVLRHAERILRASGFIDGASYAEIQLARLTAARGDVESGMALLRHASDDLDRMGASGVALEAAVHLADFLVMSGDAAGALELLDVAVTGAGEEAAVLTSAIARVSAAALAALGRGDEAEDRIEEGLKAARRHDLPYETGLLLYQRAAIARRAGKVPDLVDLTEARRVMDRLAVRSVPAFADPQRR